MKKVLQKNLENVIMQREGENLIVLNEKGDLLIVLNQTAYKLLEICGGKEANEIILEFWNLCIDKEELEYETVANECKAALDKMITVGLINVIEG